MFKLHWCIKWVNLGKLCWAFVLSLKYTKNIYFDTRKIISLSLKQNKQYVFSKIIQNAVTSRASSPWFIYNFCFRENRTGSFCSYIIEISQFENELYSKMNIIISFLIDLGLYVIWITIFIFRHSKFKYKITVVI